MSDMCVDRMTPPEIEEAGGMYENGICEEAAPRVNKVVSADEYICFDGYSMCQCGPKNNATIEQFMKDDPGRIRDRKALQKEMLKLQERQKKLMERQMRLNPAYWVDRLLKKIF